MKRFIQLLDKVYAAFGLTYVAKFGTRPAVAHRRRRALGPSRGALESAVKSLGIEYGRTPATELYGPSSTST